MFEKIAKKIGRFLLHRFLAKQIKEELNFNLFLANSAKVLFVLPENDQDFRQAFDMIRYFQSKKKNITLFLAGHRFNLLGELIKLKTILYDAEDITKTNLPGKSLESKLKNLEFDIVIDLNYSQNVFFTSVSNLPQSKYKIGFKKEFSDKYYNFQVPFKINSEISYGNLLNSLKMF
ncbi:MAG: hypothetical protein KJ799_03195 [Bacteroidetes bacterium]|nr:hypothetical protein [Bacteroidota bacterium]MBU1681152.1 hypothetical protein [Bacteroidota bacterium]MBU2505714.1 hypothetical protein [Bacteroidota bacterium]